jgi:hypothetical protein
VTRPFNRILDSSSSSEKEEEKNTCRHDKDHFPATIHPPLLMHYLLKNNALFCSSAVHPVSDDDSDSDDGDINHILSNLNSVICTY